MQQTFFQIDHRHVLVVIALWASSFAAFSLYASTTPAIFLSPDETANAVFAKHFAQNSNLKIPLPDDLATTQLIAPRSMLLNNGALVPASFPGLPVVAGFFGRLFSDAAIVFVTPLLAAAGIAAFFVVLRFLFPFHQSVIGAALLLIHPAYWYYASRGLYHNVGFVALAICSAATLIIAFREKKNTLGIIGGGLLALSLFFRFEFLPLFFIGSMAIIFFRRVIFVKQLLWCLVGFFLVVAFFLTLNLKTYGTLWTSGYTLAASVSNATPSFIHSIRLALFPFGVDITQSIVTAWNFILLAFPLFSILFLLGATRVVRTIVTTRSLSNPLAAWSSAAFVCSIFLVLYYGSWDFHEFQSSHDANVGSSYHRYWLLTTVLFVPLFVQGVGEFARVCSAAFRKPLMILFGITMLSMSVYTVFFSASYGLRTVQKNIYDEQSLAYDIRKLLPAHAVVVGEGTDKLLFPSLYVIQDFTYTSASFRDAMRNIRKSRPVYALLDAPQKELNGYLADPQRYGMLWSRVTVVGDQKILYSLYN